MKMSKLPTHTGFSEQLADDYSDALADVLCWFRGFRAGNPQAEMPPGLDRLRDLNIQLKTGGAFDLPEPPTF